MWAYQPGDSSPAQSSKQEQSGTILDEDEPLLCAVCQHRITTRRAAIAHDGAHEHIFKNPAGYIFHIGIFNSAPGCTVEGETTLEATWFLGWAWTRAHCAGCGEHLGWRYERQQSTFFGLILRTLM